MSANVFVCLRGTWYLNNNQTNNADVIKEAGERDSLWSPGWSHRGTKELQAYPGKRIKTTLKRGSELVVRQEEDKLKQSLQS